MKIIYKETKTFTKEQLEQLFQSVKWESGKYPDILVKAMLGMSTVFSAWQKDTLIGLVSTIDDGVMNAYTHYLLVNPNYQGNDIGKELMDLVKEHYKEYKSLILIACEGKVGFYEKVGYTAHQECTSMFINK